MGMTKTTDREVNTILFFWRTKYLCMTIPKKKMHRVTSTFLIFGNTVKPFFYLPKKKKMCHKFNKTSQTRLTLSSRKETKKPLFFKPKLKPEPENKMTNFPSLHATAKSIKILYLHVWFIVKWILARRLLNSNCAEVESSHFSPKIIS